MPSSYRLGKEEIVRAILMSLGVAGLVVAAAAAPNATLLLKPLIRKMNRRPIADDSLERSLRRMAKKRLVEFSVRNGKTYLHITESGRKKLKEIEFESMKIDISGSWNGVWTVILFDIPESRKTARDALRRKLKDLGCYQYHKSVFVHPVSCGDEIDFVAEFFQVGRHVIHFETRSLGNQEHRARRFFGIRGA